MKIFACLLAIVCACNATFLNLLGGKGGGSSGGSHISYSVAASPSHDHGHDHGHEVSHASSYSHDHGHEHDHYQSQGYGGSPQVINVILDAGHSGAYGSSRGYSYDGGNSYGSSGYGIGGETQIFRVITQNSAGSDPLAEASYGRSSGSSYGSDYRHGSSHSYNSQLHAILPQILQFILQDDTNYGSGGNIVSGDGGDDLNSQLIAHFGEMGSAVVKRSKPNSYYSSGHVLQKGVLKIMRVKHSSHGPPDHGW